MSRVAVLVAHPDDEVLGVGGTIRRHVEAGDFVQVHIECMRDLRGGPDRTQQAQAVADSVGYALTFGVATNFGNERIEFGGFDGFDIIYTHHPGDLNSDHRRVAEAALVAGRFARTVRTFETVSSTEWGLTPFVPDYYVGIRLDQKLQVLGEYIDEMRHYPHPRSNAGVMALAEHRATTAGLPAAEAFHTVRDSWPL